MNEMESKILEVLSQNKNRYHSQDEMIQKILGYDSTKNPDVRGENSVALISLIRQGKVKELTGNYESYFKAV